MARKKSFDRILAHLQSAAPAVRSDALGRLLSADLLSVKPSRRQRDQAFRAVAACLRDDADQTVRLDAAHVLTFWFEPRATEALLTAAAREGESALVRGQAIEGLGNTLHGARPRRLRRRAIPLLLGGLRSPAPEVRFWSIYAIGMLRALEARPILDELARTDEAMFENWWRVRDEAEDVIAALDHGEWPEREPAWLRKATSSPAAK